MGWFQRLFGRNAAGAAEGDAALDLFTAGRYDHALAVVDTALRKATKASRKHRADIQMLCLGAKTMILTGLTRYDEARATVAAMRAIGSPPASALQGAVFPELYTGQLNAALRICNEVMARDPDGHTGRITGASFAAALGDLDYALKLLDYDSDDITRHLTLAQTHLQRGDVSSAEASLVYAERVMFDHPVIALEHRKTRALVAARKRDEVDTERWLRELAGAATRAPHKRYDAEATRGECLLRLGRHEEAVSALDDASTGARHPIEQHMAGYWLARTYREMGDEERALPLYRAVASDGFGTWMEAEAMRESA